MGRGWVAALLLAGCAHYPVNPPLPAGAKDGPRKFYRYGDLASPGNSDELFVMLAFSGGGTRAAALSYGVMEGLAETQVYAEGRSRRLLDEVDVITAVSGGSFTASYYGLFGDRIFMDFEERFLKRNVQGALTARLLNPLHWFRLWSPQFNRDDLVAEYFQKELFNGLTYETYLHRGRRPFVIVNATDVAIGARFEFTQDQFDLLGSDLGPMPIGRAVAASSAVPGLFGGVTLRNHSAESGHVAPAWIQRVLSDPDTGPRLRNRAQEAASYKDGGRRRFIHLLDGGLTDNLGLRGVMDLTLLGDQVDGLVAVDPITRAQRVVLIMVDAHVQRDYGLDVLETPGLFRMLNATTSVPMNRYSFETMALVREAMQQRLTREKVRRLATMSSLSTDIEFYAVFLEFNELMNPEDQAFFQSVRTTYTLSDEQVDRLRALAREQLRHAPEFQRLVR